MNKKALSATSALLLVLLLLGTQSCKQKDAEPKTDLALHTENSDAKAKKPLTKAFKDYWYAGDAEITSYRLEQARYGEIREGTAVLIYVTEPFHAQKQVKADQNNADNIPVLKLNSTKKYLTGIYPYSIMSSSFYPVYDNDHALKLTFSSQEWCGQVFAQLNNRASFEVRAHSYFESEGDTDISLAKAVLENELWNQIRINPDGLALGKVKIIPSLEYIRLTHKELKAYDAIVDLTKETASNTLKVTYPELERTLEIRFSNRFPYTIESWSDTFKDGFGSKAKILTSKGTKVKTIKSPYWQKNSNEFLPLRDSLGL